MKHSNRIAPWLLIAAATTVGVVGGLWLSGCTGTPMPIPPSFDADRVELDSSGELCPPEECVALLGDEGAVEAGAVVGAHPVFPLLPEPMPPYLEAVEADRSGAFELLLGAPRGESAIRVVIFGAEGATALFLRPLLDSPETPQPVEVIDEATAGSCLQLSPDIIDFGPVPAGGTGTGIIELINECDGSLSVMYTEALTVPEMASGTIFGALLPVTELERGESTGVVVAFWPPRSGVFNGVVLASMMGHPEFEAITISVPLTGRGEL